jgi:hypothetical protein
MHIDLIGKCNQIQLLVEFRPNFIILVRIFGGGNVDYEALAWMFESEFLAEDVGGIWEKKGPICFLKWQSLQ